MVDMNKLATAIRKRNIADEEIAVILDRPAQMGHAGETIAESIFNIKLQNSASHKGIDGSFNSGDLAGKMVNIKWYGKREGILDINLEALPDFYLVMTGPKGTSASSRGTVRPWVIYYVYLFESSPLIQNLNTRHIKPRTATSVRNELWEKAEIYPSQKNKQLIITKEQKKLLSLFL